MKDDEKVTFYETNWSLRKVPEYGLPHFKVGKREREVDNLNRWIENAIEASRPNVGVLRAEWGFGKTHLFLNLIEERFNEGEEVLPIYIEFKDLYENGFKPDELGGEKQDRRTKVVDILKESCLKGLKKYEDSYEIPYQRKLNFEIERTIKNSQDKEIGEILSDFDNIMIIIDETEDLLNPTIGDDEIISLFFDIFIKDFVEKKLPINDDVFLLLGCTTPAWETYRTHFGDIFGRYVRREDEFELPPLDLEESIRIIKKVINTDTEDQDFPFRMGALSTISRISMGSPFTLLSLYDLVASNAIDKSSVTEDNKIHPISYENVIETLIDKEIDLYKGRKSKSIDGDMYKRFAEIIDFDDILDLFVGELGFFNLSDIQERLDLEENKIREGISDANTYCKDSYGRKLFEKYRHIDCEKIELKKILRENGYLTDEGQMFRMDFEEEFLPKMTYYQIHNESLSTEFYLPIHVHEFQDVFGVVLTEELKEKYLDLIQTILPTQQETYYHLSEFASRRLFPTAESKMLSFLRDPISRREYERKIEDIFWGDSKGTSLSVAKGLKKLYTKELEDKELEIEKIHDGETPYLVIKYFNRGVENSDHNIRIMIHPYNFRYDKETLKKVSKKMEEEKANLSIILYKEREEEVMDSSKKMEVDGWPLNDRIIWKTVEKNFLRFLTAIGIMDEESEFDEEDKIDERIFKESIRLYLKDFDLISILDDWLNEKKDEGLGYHFNLRWDFQDYVVQEIPTYWKYWLLPYPEPTNPDDAPIELICFGGPRKSVKNNIENVSQDLAKENFLKEDNGTYVISENENEVFLVHYLLRKDLDEIKKDKLIKLMISDNDNVPPSKTIETFLAPFLQEKGIISKDNGTYQFNFNKEDKIHDLKRKGEEKIEAIEKLREEWQEKDKYNGSDESYEDYVRGHYKDKNKWGALGDAVKYTGQWGSEPKIKHLFKAYLMEKNKFEMITQDFGSFQNKFEDLLDFSKDTGEEGIEKTQKLIEHFCKFSIPTQILSEYVQPQLKDYIEIVDKYRSKGEDFVEKLHKDSYVKTVDVREKSKELHSMGEYGKLKNLYNKIEALYSSWEEIQDDMEDDISDLKEKYDEGLKSRNRLRDNFKDFQNNDDPKFSKYILNTFFTLDIDEIRNDMDKKREKVLTSINLDEKDLGTRLESELRDKLNSLIEKEETKIKTLKNLISHSEKFFDVEKDILEFMSREEELNNILDKVKNNPQGIEMIEKSFKEFEDSKDEYNDLKPGEELNDIDEESLNNTKKKLDSIKDGMESHISTIESQYKLIKKDIQDEKKYLNYLSDKITDDTERENIKDEIDEIDENGNWEDCREKLDSVFSKIMKSIDVEGWEKNDFKTFKIIYRSIINESGKDFDNLVSICKDEMDISTEEAKDRLLDIVDSDFLDVYFDIKEIGD